LYIHYHDFEWGSPIHDDKLLFEFLILEGFQAGLSWRTVLYKRNNFRQAFDDFDVEKISSYDPVKIAELLSNPGIIRNKSKIQACVTNSQAFLKVKQEFGTFDAYIWSFVQGKTIHNKWKCVGDLPSETRESEKMSADLTMRGFKFVGPKICYAYMQATGMVNDHTTDCYRYNELVGKKTGDRRVNR